MSRTGGTGPVLEKIGAAWCGDVDVACSACSACSGWTRVCSATPYSRAMGCSEGLRTSYGTSRPGLPGQGFHERISSKSTNCHGDGRRRRSSNPSSAAVAAPPAAANPSRGKPQPRQTPAAATPSRGKPQPRQTPAAANPSRGKPQPRQTQRSKPQPRQDRRGSAAAARHVSRATSSSGARGSGTRSTDSHSDRGTDRARSAGDHPGQHPRRHGHSTDGEPGDSQQRRGVSSVSSARLEVHPVASEAYLTGGGA